MSEYFDKFNSVQNFLDTVDQSDFEKTVGTCYEMLNDYRPDFFGKLRLPEDALQLQSLLHQRYQGEDLSAAQKNVTEYLLIFVEYIFFREEYEDRIGLNFNAALQELRKVLQIQVKPPVAEQSNSEDQKDVIDLQLKAHEALKKGLSGGVDYDDHRNGHSN